MMSVLIKGIGVPENCVNCKIKWCPAYLADDFSDKRAPNCPLIYVPRHGRLIDADALIAEFHRLTLGENSLIERVFADGVYAVIENAPTIIEAED